MTVVQVRRSGVDLWSPYAAGRHVPSGGHGRHDGLTRRTHRCEQPLPHLQRLQPRILHGEYRYRYVEVYK